MSICQLINNVDNHIRDFENHPDKRNNSIFLSYADLPEYETENHFANIEGHIIEDNDLKNNVNGLCTTIDSLARFIRYILLIMKTY